MSTKIKGFAKNGSAFVDANDVIELLESNSTLSVINALKVLKEKAAEKKIEQDSNDFGNTIKDGEEKIKDLFHRFDTNLNSVELEKGIDEFFGGADKIIKALLK